MRRCRSGTCADFYSILARTGTLRAITVISMLAAFIKRSPLHQCRHTHAHTHAHYPLPDAEIRQNATCQLSSLEPPVSRKKNRRKIIKDTEEDERKTKMWGGE